MAKNITKSAHLLSLKHCSHLDYCNYFGNCMTYGSNEEAFCNCIALNLDHTCADRSLPKASALIAEPNDFFYPIIALLILTIVILAVLYLVTRKRRSTHESDTHCRGISIALKTVDEL